MSAYFQLTSVAVSLLLSMSGAFASSMNEMSGQQLYTNGVKADYLAGFHSQKVNASCNTCHPSGTVSDSEREIDKNCQSCHGSYLQMGEKDKSNGLAISAHQGHLSINSCTTCHQGHTASFAYCNNCHIFNMPMKFGRAKVPFVPEDLSYYKNAVPNHEETTDVVIVGGGGAGMVAAIELRNLCTKGG